MKDNKIINENDISQILAIYMNERGIETLCIVTEINDNKKMDIQFFGGLKGE